MNRAAVTVIILILLLGFFPGCIFPGENLPPEPNLRASATFVNVNESVIFSANDSSDSDGEIVRYFWDFDDGTNATAKWVNHYYEKGGNYTVILIITDNDNKKAVQAMTIHVNELPRPNINISLPAYIHEPVYFWANDSYDPDGFIMDYFWDFSDGTNATGTGASNVFHAKELSKVTLTVVDNDGAKAATSRMFPVQYRTYKVVWVTDTVLLPDNEGYGDYLREGNSELFTVNIDIPNITKILFNLTWEDMQPLKAEPPLLEDEPNDEFILNITSPEGDMYEGGPSTSEKIVVKAPKSGYMNEIPPPMTKEAESAEILESLLAENHTGYKGKGKWAINITLTDAGGVVEPPIGPEDFDYGENWTLLVTCFYYSPVITKL